MIGILLTNIGTPVSQEPEDVGHYLAEFLMDPYVVDIPVFWRWVLVKLLIVPRRKFASSEAYKKIWLENGSPLLVHSKELAKKLNQLLGENFSVKVGMRYSSPSIESAIKDFKQEKISKLIVVPMYPQFADSSSTSSLEKAKQSMAISALQIEMKSIESFYDDPGFISSYAELIRKSLSGKKVDHYLFSYHGLPERQIKRLHPDYCFQSKNCCDKIGSANKNCYRAQCVQTTRALAQALDLNADQYSFSFQSRLGRTKWIDPYTDVTLPELAKKGVKNLAVVCPSFVSDCPRKRTQIRKKNRHSRARAVCCGRWRGSQAHPMPECRRSMGRRFRQDASEIKLKIHSVKVGICIRTCRPPSFENELITSSSKEGGGDKVDAPDLSLRKTNRMKLS